MGGCPLANGSVLLTAVDPHVVSTALQEWLLSSPPLISGQFYRDFVDVGKVKDKEKMCRELLYQFYRLPKFEHYMVNI